MIFELGNMKTTAFQCRKIKLELKEIEDADNDNRNWIRQFGYKQYLKNAFRAAYNLYIGALLEQLDRSKESVIELPYSAEGLNDLLDELHDDSGDAEKDFIDDFKGLLIMTNLYGMSSGLLYDLCKNWKGLFGSIDEYSVKGRIVNEDGCCTFTIVNSKPLVE